MAVVVAPLKGGGKSGYLYPPRKKGDPQNEGGCRAAISIRTRKGKGGRSLEPCSEGKEKRGRTLGLVAWKKESLQGGRARRARLFEEGGGKREKRGYQFN